MRRAAALLDVHDRLLPEPEPELLAEVVARHALGLLSTSTKFQVFTLLAVLEAVDRVLDGWRRSDGAVVSGRDGVATWERDGDEVRAYYDTAAKGGKDAEVMRHYIGRDQKLRPDIRIVDARGGGRELVVDAKYSVDPSYLARAHHQMHGYVADRPQAFDGEGLKAVVVCPGPLRGEPRPSDAVAFVDADGCEQRVLERVLSAWWNEVSRAAPQSPTGVKDE